MNMDREKQDRRWNELSEESKNEVRMTYEVHKPPCANLIEDTEPAKEVRLTLENLFGSHNLNPKPQIKTWEDVEKVEGGDISVDSKVINPNGRAWGLGLKYHQKAEATLKLAILIDLGYGGVITEEEWKDDKTSKYCIERTDNELVYAEYSTIYYFIAFHTSEQRKEFMSHGSNRKLVEQFYMI